MSALDVGPCEPWPYLCNDFPEDPDEHQQALIDQAVLIATEVLWNRTKRRFGTCELTLRPCRRDCWPESTWAMWSSTWHNVSSVGWPFPALIGGQWFNLGCGGCGDYCSCTILHEVLLPYPVADIISVKIDGAVLPESAYRVVNRKLLLRVDGEAWPRCNDLSLPDTEEGTWSVTAKYGLAVPLLGQYAVGQLAAAIYKACIGAKDCPLPITTVRQVSRQGVTKVFFDAETAFKSGKIGLYYPDLFIHTYNPSNTGTAVIFDIDGPRRRTVSF